VKLLFDKKFLKDIEYLPDKKLKKRIEQIITDAESSKSLNEIGNLKKMKGHVSAYRIRVGQYRIGFFAEKNVLKFICFMHRKDIYKKFP
jgi:mRNA interferase RelE/StbE